MNECVDGEDDDDDNRKRNQDEGQWIGEGQSIELGLNREIYKNIENKEREGDKGDTEKESEIEREKERKK